MKNYLILVFLLISLLLLAGCSKSVSDITANDKYVGETITVAGVAKDPLIIGDLAGFTLVDDNGDEIIVSAVDIPSEGESVKVKGVLKEGPLGIGYYIDSK